MFNKPFGTTQYHLLSLTCCVPFLRIDQYTSNTMEFVYLFNLVFIFVVNILFFFSGICLNSLVVVSLWKSAQLRKKTCNFMIMVLSFCDLLLVLTNHPLTALVVMLWLTEKIKVYPVWLLIPYELSDISFCASFLALFVMNFDRYLSTHYPIFHRASVTKAKLLTLFTTLEIVGITVIVISTNDLVIPYQVGILALGMVFIPPMLLVNYKLFAIARKSRRNTRMPLKTEKSLSLKHISSCLLAVACLALLFIPTVIYIVLRLTTKDQESTLDRAALAGLWSRSTASMNATFNCLIFYWKNKTLRTEGMTVIKRIKTCQRFQIPPYPCSTSRQQWEMKKRHNVFKFEERIETNETSFISSSRQITNCLASDSIKARYEITKKL